MNRIREILEEKGLTAKDLAKILGVSPPAVSIVINGNPKQNTLEEYATALGVPIAELFEKKDYTRGTCPHCGQPITIELKKES
ncbi:MAG: helix-turn-helix transcriptional regulator [Prevotellaceae bacterium]|jgi:transcriptional regulator with XRE-family HTH domain|nr:helix-turn-helix transcriptional regulator [Prevotellaceae bacterium]